MRNATDDRWPLPGRATDAILWVIAMSYLGQILLEREAAEIAIGREGLDGLIGFSTASLWAAGAHAPRAILESGEWWRLFTPAWLHGGLLHVAMNAMALRSFGAMAESIYGPFRFLFAYLVCGVGASVLSLGYDVATGGLGGPSIGASGAVCGLGGLLLVAFRRRNDATGEFMARQLTIWLIVMLLISFLVPQINAVAHIAGFLVGGVLGALLDFGQFDHLRGKSPAVRLRVAAMLLLVVANAAAIAFAAIPVRERMSEEVGVQRMIHRAVRNVEPQRRIGVPAEDLASRLRAVRGLALPAEGDRIRDEMLDLLRASDYPVSASKQARFGELTAALLALRHAQNPDRYPFLPRRD